MEVVRVPAFQIERALAVAPGVRVRLDDIMVGNHEGWWTIQLAEKDLTLALDLASAGGTGAELGKTAEHLLQQTDQAGFGSRDPGAVVEVMRSPRRGGG